MPTPQVLVLEDREAVRDLWTEGLEEAGYPAVGMASGTEALARLPELTPQLILLDIRMPHMDGIQFLARLRANLLWSHIPVLIISGIGDELLKLTDRPLSQFPTLSVRGILQKPVQLETLIERVRQVIGPGAPVGQRIQP